MNIVRKIVGGQKSSLDGAQSVQDNTLGLMHLRKLFSEFRTPSSAATQKELKDKLYNMLPLFCKVFGTAPSSDMTEKFPDILQFCGHVSRLMVSEIRKRASDQSTDAASYAIVKFLEIESTEELSSGWMLLSTINLLSSGASSLIDCMTAACLPSTLVKCLYLFFDLPDVQDADLLEPGCEFSARERRVLLQKVFVQVLVRLCSHVSPSEELARKDDLALLFSAITSWCPPHNIPWRKSAAEVLMTLSRHGLTPNVVQYIHSKGCVALCIDNMQRVQELSPIELVEMFVTVFCFLKDSSDVSQMLMDDFRTCQGYLFLTDFLLKMEKNDSEEAIQALRNLVLLVGSLTTCGYIELKPSNASSGSLFQIPGFTIPQPTGKGVSVRNVQAFQVLQTVFLKGTSINLCSTILDVISSIYHQDSANYFILEPQNTLSQFAEKIHLKTMEIQGKFFEILEFLVFNLNFVPCKELISLSILIKTNHSLESSILCIKTLLKILNHHIVYKDVFREVGLLEVMVTCLHRYAALLKETQSDTDMGCDDIPEKEQEIGFLVMDALSLLLNNNNNNASVFRECGGARCAHNMVPYVTCRQQALNTVQQLILSNGGDDDMGTLLGLMHTAPITALELKTHVLKSLLLVLRESHRTRTVFRKVGGFVYVMSVLVSMEGCLAEPPKAPWDTEDRKDIITLLKTVFSTLTVAMRYEPANARVFATEVRYASLTEAVRLLGCFSNETHIMPQTVSLPNTDEENEFSCLFSNIHHTSIAPVNVPLPLHSACLMLRYLYDMALDNFDRPVNQTSTNSGSSSPNMKRISSVLESSSNNKDLVSLAQTPKRASTGSLVLNLQPSQAEPILVHAGAVISMLHLVPAVYSQSCPQLALELQLHTGEVIRTLVRTERNQQVMCEAGLPHELLTYFSVPLTQESSVLHSPLQYQFERLAAQCLTPKDLRDFLRLGFPLCCTMEREETFDQSHDCCNNSSHFLEKPGGLVSDRRSHYDISNKLQTNGGAVPLTRVKCLVSMTTPRDVRLHGATITPAFVEFDMSAEGFGGLYLPSIAPQGPPTPSVVGAGMIGGSDPGVVGGIGTGERLFPPQSGITFSSWLCIDKFSTPSQDPHPVRLLTVVRNIQGREENLICLRVFLAPRDRALFVSTHETMMPVAGDMHHEPALNDTTVRFWCPELTQEGQWRHLVLIFHKAGIMKNSSVSLFIDGAHVNTQKLHYISPNLGGTGTASPNAATSVFAYIGTPPQLRRQSRLLWRQGPCYLFEDIVTSGTVTTLYQLGPNYIGSFQAPILDSSDTPSVVIAEEKLMFGIHAHAMSLMTVARIRKVYNKTDSKSIAKQLGMSAHENATPIRILHNSAGHLSGSARSFGAVLMGYLGVRTFCPKPVAKMIMNVGGTSALLGLIAMATDVEGLYAAVKALVCVVRSNKDAAREMDRTKGYQTLAILFKKKRQLLNSHILHLTFSLIGTLDSRRETTIIPNKIAFEDLLCDLEVWRDAPCDLQRSLYEHFYELLTESSDQKNILRLMQEMGLVNKLLYILRDSSLTRLTAQTIMSVLSVLLCGQSHGPSLLRFGQFMVGLLPNHNCNERCVTIDSEAEFIGGKRPTPTEGDLFDDSGSPMVYNIKLRNLCLEMLLRLLTMTPTSHGINQVFSEELQKVLGFDWLLLFMRSNVHSTTVVTVTRVLVLMLRNPQNMNRFREGSHAGGWLTDIECVLKNRIGVLLGFNVGAGSQKIQNREVNRDICHMPGFTYLQWLLPQHPDVPQLYLIVMCMLLGQPIKQLPKQIQQFDLDTMWTVIFGGRPAPPTSSKNHKHELCGEAASVLLAMVRALLNQPWEAESEGSWVREYPVTAMQFILYLYHNQPEFVPLCMTGDFLTALSATVFPYRASSEANSEITSPLEDFKPFPGADSMVLVRSPENRSGASFTNLSSHPAKKFVMDFLRTIIVDSLSLPQSNKSAPVIDLILEVSPENSTRSQRKEFQTQILNNLMDHLLAADVLLGEQAALPVVTGGSYTHMANNVFYLAGRVVDKLWQGAYVRDPKEVFEFISKLISQAKRKASGVSLDTIYKCLNRTILFQLSRSMTTLADHTNILDALHKLTENRTLIFGPGNFDQEFIGCLCYCLLQLTDDPRNISDPPALRTTTWHVENNSNDTDMDDRFTDPVRSPEGLILLATAAQRVWDELYFCKKPAMEEIFKVTLSSPDTTGNKYAVPELGVVRALIQETAGKMWLTYFENERKCVYSNTERIQNQLQSKLQKVGHGVLRLAQRKTKKDLPVKTMLMTSQECLTWTTTHVNIVRDLVEFQYKQYQESQLHMKQYLLEEWGQVEAELMRERGLWGPPVGSELDKLMLDLTEGPHRMRKKMILNDMFYINYPYRPITDENRPTKYKMAISLDSKKHYERYRSRSLVADEELPALTTDLGYNNSLDQTPQNDDTFDDLAVNTPSLLPKLRKAKSNHADNEDETDLDVSLSADGATEAGGEGEGQTDAENKTDNQIILKLLDEGEKISHMFRSARIQGLDTMEGLLLFGKEHFYIVDGFTLLRTKEIADIDNLPSDMHDPIIPKTAKTTGMKKTCLKFPYEAIREVHKRRYLLQPIAVEVFSADGRNILLACPRKVRNKVYARFMTLATAITDSAQESVSGQKQNAKVEPGTGLISSLIGEKSVTQRWERGEISNFEYLMCLNTLAGRSYNDLMQYPVFPWIVADYLSEELDLNDPESFRDLSKPMGAQTPNRLKQFKKRYTDWDDPQGETPPYHYGTHYSSAMIVASYLVRMEPFTQIFLSLQGGHFDLADRMFHSVGDAWLSASKHNMADVKELIPEFFYLPEFLVNSNSYDLGVKQSGVALGDIKLPTWAKGDPREFIRVHREALECDYVSMHINEWIDLVFGHKQQGPTAVDAVNVFHHLFYEGNVDIYSIEDPLKKNATIGFINNFGQIPKQLFKKPHPQKKLNLRNLDPLPLGSMFSSQSDKLFFHHLDNLRPTMQPIKELKNAVGQIIHNEKTILAVEQNKVLIPPNYSKYLAWGFSDLSLRIGNYDSDKASMVFESVGSGEIMCASCPDSKTVITGGTSTVVYVWEFGKGKDKKNLCLKRSLYGHTEPVTCLAASPEYNIIVSGSRDRTCIVWDLSRLAFVRQLRGHAAPVAAVCINELTGDIATCAGTYLHIWSINGDEIASINTATGRNQQILCVAMSQMMEWDARNVIMTGNSDGVVRMWSIEFVEVVDSKSTLNHGQSTDSTDGKSSDAASVTSTASQPQPIPGSRKISLIDEPPEERSAADRLQDFKDPEFLAAKAEELGSSAESDGNAEEMMRQRVETLLGHSSRSFTDTDVGGSPSSVAREAFCTEAQPDLISFDESDAKTNGKKAASVTVDIAGANMLQPSDPKSSQRDPKSPSADFVLVTETDVKDALVTALQDAPGSSKKRRLRCGFHWQRQLVFRSKLTMHTAFERKDNKDPAAVTALAVSKDHKTVYVGDAKGRVYSWTVTDQPGRVVADHWVKDEGGENCVSCNVKFSFSERRHHCRNCGQLFCSRCSRFETEIKRLRILKPVRVCQTCYNSLKAQQASDALARSLNAKS